MGGERRRRPGAADGRPCPSDLREGDSADLGVGKEHFTKWAKSLSPGASRGQRHVA